MCETLRYKNYSVILSLNERNIFIKLSDNITWCCYECNVDGKELRLSFGLEDIFNIIASCFRNDTDYNVETCITNNIMKLFFRAKVGGFLKIQFEINVKEKVISNDGQMSIKLNQMEHKYEELEKRLGLFEYLFQSSQQENKNIFNILSNAEIRLGPYTYPIGTNEIVISSQDGWISPGNDYNKIEWFYRLKKLQIHSHHTILQNICFKNNTVEYLHLHGCSSLASLSGIENMQNLTELSFSEQYGLSNIVEILENYNHKILKITISNCPSVDKLKLQTYCQIHHIVLAIQ
jgi:hypothetical protein